MNHRLPDGKYPFADKILALSELAMMEAPPELEAILRRAAELNGVKIITGQPVELRCLSAGFPDATFIAFLPHEDDRLHVLAPKANVKGRA